MTGGMVSIIVPAYNAERTLARMIEAVLAQTYRNIELIVVDDGSKDGTIEVVRKFMDDRRVKAIMQVNGGVSTARNAGIKAADGEYLMFFDADDDVSRTIVEEMLSAAKKRQNSLVVCGKKIGERKILPSKAGLVDVGLKRHVIRAILKDGLLYSPCNKIYRADIISERDVRFEEKIKFGEDLIFNLKYLEYMNSIYYLRKPLYIYEQSMDGSSATTAGVQKYRDRMYVALKNYVGKDGESVVNRILLRFVKMRWNLSVRKARLRGGRHG